MELIINDYFEKYIFGELQYAISVGIVANDDSIVKIKNIDVIINVQQQDLTFSNMHAAANIYSSNQVKNFIDLPNEYKITYVPSKYHTNGIAPVEFVFDFCTNKSIKSLTLQYLIELNDRTITEKVELKMKKKCYFSVH
ncbi:hypothetical protein FACS189429_1820 [Bacteroidia bacterium]|nr:hypothetical protein FACS189429_1820 [Bacteroidia bacterium]GHV44113.1 hypothetical protein FACS1894180_5040 [Bacteroidia bacterium]